MVDAIAVSGKNSDNRSAWLPVVAGAIFHEDGRCLMHRRPPHKHHGGLWEFPGGKVEASEIPVQSLVRELREELGIEVRQEDCEPVCFAEEAGDNGERPIVILLYRIAAYQGKPLALEGGEIGWFTRAQVKLLAKPPLDIALAKRLFDSRR